MQALCSSCSRRMQDSSSKLEWLYRNREEWTTGCLLIEGGAENQGVRKNTLFQQLEVEQNFMFQVQCNNNSNKKVYAS